MSAVFLFFAWPAAAACSVSAAFSWKTYDSYFGSLPASRTLDWVARLGGCLLGVATLSPGLLLWRVLGDGWTSPNAAGPFGLQQLLTGSEQIFLRFAADPTNVVGVVLTVLGAGTICSLLVRDPLQLSAVTLIVSTSLLFAGGLTIARMGWIELPPGIPLTLAVQATVLAMVGGWARYAKLPTRWRVGLTAALTAVGVLAPVVVWGAASSRIDERSAWTRVLDINAEARTTLVSTTDRYGNTVGRVLDLDNGDVLATLPRGGGGVRLLRSVSAAAYVQFSRQWGFLTSDVELRIRNLGQGSDTTQLRLSTDDAEPGRFAFPVGVTVFSPDERWLGMKYGGSFVLGSTSGKTLRVGSGLSADDRPIGWTRSDQTFVYVRARREQLGMLAPANEPVGWDLVEVDVHTGEAVTEFRLPFPGRDAGYAEVNVVAFSGIPSRLDRRAVPLSIYYGFEDPTRRPELLLVNLETLASRSVDDMRPIRGNADGTEGYWLDWRGESETVLRRGLFASNQTESLSFGSLNVDVDAPFGGFDVSPDGACGLVSDAKPGMSGDAHFRCFDGRSKTLSGWFGTRLFTPREAIVERYGEDWHELGRWDLTTGQVHTLFRTGPVPFQSARDQS